MSRAWRIRIQSRRPRKQPEIDLLVRAVVALGEQMQAEADKQNGSTEDRPTKREDAA